MGGAKKLRAQGSEHRVYGFRLPQTNHPVRDLLAEFIDSLSAPDTPPSKRRGNEIYSGFLLQASGFGLPAFCSWFQASLSRCSELMQIIGAFPESIRIHFNKDILYSACIKRCEKFLPVNNSLPDRHLRLFFSRPVSKMG